MWARQSMTGVVRRVVSTQQRRRDGPSRPEPGEYGKGVQLRLVAGSRGRPSGQVTLRTSDIAPHPAFEKRCSPVPHALRRGVPDPLEPILGSAVTRCARCRRCRHHPHPSRDAGGLPGPMSAHRSPGTQSTRRRRRRFFRQRGVPGRLDGVRRYGHELSGRARWQRRRWQRLGPGSPRDRSSVPDVVADELMRLAPRRIVVLGGSGSITERFMHGFVGPGGEITRATRPG